MNHRIVIFLVRWCTPSMVIFFSTSRPRQTKIFLFSCFCCWRSCEDTIWIRFPKLAHPMHSQLSPSFARLCYSLKTTLRWTWWMSLVCCSGDTALALFLPAGMVRKEGINLDGVVFVSGKESLKPDSTLFSGVIVDPSQVDQANKVHRKNGVSDWDQFVDCRRTWTKYNARYIL